MAIFTKKTFIPPPYKRDSGTGTAEVVFHYRNEVPQAYTLPPGIYPDVPIALPVAVKEHPGTHLFEPFVWESPRNQYVRIAASVRASTTTSGSLPGSAIAVRLTSLGDTRDVFFARERARQTDGLETDYAFDGDSYLYLRAGDRLSLVVRMLNSTNVPVECTITEAQFLATQEHNLLDRYIS